MIVALFFSLLYTLHYLSVLFTWKESSILILEEREIERERERERERGRERDSDTFRSPRDWRRVGFSTAATRHTAQLSRVLQGGRK